MRKDDVAKYPNKQSEQRPTIYSNKVNGWWCVEFIYIYR